MDKRIRNLWVKALKGNRTAYRKLGIMFLQGAVCKRDRELAKLCLDKAIEMGDEKSYFLYHKEFSKKKKVIDDRSYEEMRRDYQNAVGGKDKEKLEKLEKYLSVRMI